MTTWAGGAAIVLAIGLIAADHMYGQDVQPRVYTTAPVGVNVAMLGYSYSRGSVLFDKTIPVEDAVGDIHSLAAGYSRSIGVAEMAGRSDVALPFVIGEREGLVQRELADDLPHRLRRSHSARVSGAKPGSMVARSSPTKTTTESGSPSLSRLDPDTA